MCQRSLMDGRIYRESQHILYLFVLATYDFTLSVSIYCLRTIVYSISKSNTYSYFQKTKNKHLIFGYFILIDAKLDYILNTYVVMSVILLEVYSLLDLPVKIEAKLKQECTLLVILINTTSRGLVFSYKYINHWFSTNVLYVYFTCCLF